MKKNGFSHIRRWFWVHLLLVLLTTLVAYLFVYKEIVQFSLVPAYVSDVNPAQQSLSPATSGEFKMRVVLVLSAGMLSIVIISVIWLRIAMHRIQKPIDTIQQAVFRLAQGKLNETVAIETMDEFGQIGSSINELAANLQELLLYIWKQSGQCVQSLDKIHQYRSGLPESERLSHGTDQHLHELAAAIESLREMAKSYVFYDVRLDGEKALAISRPDTADPADILHAHLETPPLSTDIEQPKI
jgi:methyl-accepting chemotaxis protein